MEIRKTMWSDLDEVMSIYAHARTFMAEHGNPHQWGNTKPLQKDVEKDAIVAVFYFAIEEDPTYAKIYEGTWLNEQSYGVVHRIASAGTVKGAGTFCLRWAYGQCENLRIDTHRDNAVMQKMLTKNGFRYCGIIHLLDGDERLAYQKALLVEDDRI